jgi:FMN phosphatase YigB (HAD superfamily)
MTLTLLLDLDDTLLGNSMDTFIPAYLQSLSDFFSPFVSPDKFLPTLLSGTQAMLDNNSPEKSLKAAFDQSFYPKLGVREDAFAEQFNAFYRERFPELRQLTQYSPAAVRMIEEAFDRDYKVAIATNPLFPKSAIYQRLEWAGLSPDNYPFLLIPSYETFHFAKPNKAFFTETLACLGWYAGPVVMVGDDFDHDIAPARSLGIGNYWVTDDQHSPTQELPAAAGWGNIQGLIPWIDSVVNDNLGLNYNHLETMLAVLRSTPAVLHTYGAAFEPANWEEQLQPGEWSYTEIMCHLRDVDSEVNLPRIMQVLNEENPFLPGIDSDKWAHERLYYCQNGPDALKDFTNTRIKLLEILDSLQPSDWQRPASHAIFGPTNLKELVNIIVGHDQLHIQQAFNAQGDINDSSTSPTPRL